MMVINLIIHVDLRDGVFLLGKFEIRVSGNLDSTRKRVKHFLFFDNFYEIMNTIFLNLFNSFTMNQNVKHNNIQRKLSLQIHSSPPITN